MNKKSLLLIVFELLLVNGANLSLVAQEKDAADKTLHVFIFAGQSNMVEFTGNDDVKVGYCTMNR